MQDKLGLAVGLGITWGFAWCGSIMVVVAGGKESERAQRIR